MRQIFLCPDNRDIPRKVATLCARERFNGGAFYGRFYLSPFRCCCRCRHSTELSCRYCAGSNTDLRMANGNLTCAYGYLISVDRTVVHGTTDSLKT